MLPSGPMAIRTDRGASSSLFILRFLLTATFDSFFRVSHTWQFLFCHGVPEQASTQVFLLRYNGGGGGDGPMFSEQWIIIRAIVSY